VAAVGNNGLDVSGVCWNVRIMALKILNADGDGSAANAVPAIYYAVANGADIISGSWGGQNGSEALREAIAYAHRQGVIVVAAAGNDGANVPYYPAAYPNVLSVAATDATDRRWHLSNYGDWVDIAAPGHNILSLRRETPDSVAREEFTRRMSGTSMAAPHVSGACALLLSANPWLTCDELQTILKSTGDPIAPGICSSNGRLNVYNALRAVIPPEGTVRLDREHYADGARIGILVTDWHLQETGRQVVLVEAESGDVEAVTLTETQTALGAFRGDILLRDAPAEPGDGVLQAGHDQRIFVRYLDEDDGLGGTDQWREATARADYAPPIVLDVQVQVRGSTATVTLLTDEPARAEIRYSRLCEGPFGLVQKSAQLSESHSIDLRNLMPQTKYCFLVTVTDEAGNETSSDTGQPYSFTTAGRLWGFRVPADHATIQAAIDAAADGDTIWVADGTYSGKGNIEIDFRGKAITVRSENGSAACIIDCQGKGRAFHFRNGETANSVLDGFTITNGGNSDYGAGIHCVASSPTIRNCLFLRNVARHFGGGMANSSGSHPTVVDCTFRENSSASLGLFGRGGGMANRDGSNPIVSNCTFLHNWAKYAGGAIGNFDGSSPRVTRCRFSGNSARYSGGAVANWKDSRPIFRECVFSGNRSDNDGGAVANLDGSAPTFTNCVFSRNTAYELGGAMYNQAAEVAIGNCTISGNHAERSGGGIWSGEAALIRLDNSILWANTDDTSGQRIELAQIVMAGTDTQIRYCNIQGWTGALGGIGNFGLDPLFVDPAREDFHLQSEGWRWDRLREEWTSDPATSPCIDAGDPDHPLGGEPTTIPGDPSGTPAGNVRINMGTFGGTSKASLAPPDWTLLADESLPPTPQIDATDRHRRQGLFHTRPPRRRTR
jgi:hypothetical protein